MKVNVRVLKEKVRLLREESNMYLTDYTSKLLREAADIIEYFVENESREDAVSRQAVIKTLDNMDNVLDEDRTIENYKELLKECYEVLPPVNPQPKTGYWIDTNSDRFVSHRVYKCSECDTIEIEYPENIYRHFRYCPNCGAKMESGGKE